MAKRAKKVPLKAGEYHTEKLVKGSVSFSYM